MASRQITVADVTRAMQQIAPVELAEKWDNVGLLFGDPADAVVGILLCIDYTPAVEAERAMMTPPPNMVIAYHPTLFNAARRFSGESMAYRAMRAGVAVYSPHTAWDTAAGGVSDLLADVCGLTEVARLKGENEVSSSPGPGRIGKVAGTVSELTERIKSRLGIATVLVSGDSVEPVKRAAVCAGSAGELIPEAIAAGADVFVTGELRHHDVLAANAAGVRTVCVLHSVSERFSLRAIATRLEATLGAGGLAHLSQADVEPQRFM